MRTEAAVLPISGKIPNLVFSAFFASVLAGAFPATVALSSKIYEVNRVYSENLCM